MPIVQSFAPVEEPHAKILILGSMPGTASLRAAEYYAHPRNAFWRIMRSLIPLAPDASFAQKIQALKSAHIALWDVLHTCAREGSLDADIEHASRIPNDFQAFFLHHPQITHVFFNGTVAEHAFRKQVLPCINMQGIACLRLPSTSPANASMSYEQKRDIWTSALGHALFPDSKR